MQENTAYAEKAVDTIVETTVTTTEKEEPKGNASGNMGTTPFSKKLNAFFDKNFALFLTPIILLGLYFLTSWVYGVYPFSKKYTAASYDFSAQICPFFEHIFDVLKGKSSLTYSYSIMGGADVTGMFLYTFVSPFSVLFLVCGEGNVVYTAAFVVGFKLATVGFAGTWFVRKLFKNIPEYLSVIIGIVYAFCGYAFVASTFIAWLDLLIYTPFCVGAFCRFVKTGSFWRFSVLVSCCIYTHFSIASFALFTVFPALIAYALFCVEKERRYKFIARLCVAFLLAVVMSLPILIPALVAFLRSSRGGGIFDMIWFGYDTAKNELTSSSEPLQTFTGRFTEYFYRKGTYILADAAFVALTVAWFFRNGLKSSMAKFMLTAGALTLLPVLVDESMLLLNMGSYFSYALRFGFLNAVYFMGGACLCLNELCYEKGRAYDGKRLYVDSDEPCGMDQNPVHISQSTEKTAVKKEKPVTKDEVRVWTYVMIGVGALAIVALALLCFFSWFINSDTTAGNNFYNKYKHLDLVYNLRNVPGSFAHSLGGAELICIPFFIIGLVLLLGGWLISGKKLSVRTLSIVMSVLLSVQTLFSCGLMVEGNRSTQHNALEDYKTMSATISEQDDGHYRTKDFGRMYYKKVNGKNAVRLENVWSDCISFPGDTNSFSVFSSIIDADNYECRALFGYQGGSASFKGQHNYSWSYRADLFADSFLGYKYMYVPNSSRTSGGETVKTKVEFEEQYGVNTDKAYVEKVYDLDENGKQVLNDKGKPIHVGSGGYYAYENKAVFPMGYRISGDVEPYKFVVENKENSPGNRKKNLKALYDFLNDKKYDGSSTEITNEMVMQTSEYLHSKAADVQVGAGEITATVTAEKDGEYLFLSFVASKGYTVTVNGKAAELIDNDMKMLSVELEDGENVVEFTYSSPYKKYATVGVVGALIGLCAVAFVVKKTKLVEWASPVIAVAGVALAVGLVAFFMLYPTGVCVVKLIDLAKAYWPW